MRRISRDTSTGASQRTTGRIPSPSAIPPYTAGRHDAYDSHWLFAENLNLESLDPAPNDPPPDRSDRHMNTDHTQAQTDEERQRAQQLSLQQRRPPGEIPGYEIQRFLGAGAYGEVWVGVDQNTGRQVAIKFYTHRGGLDWSLLNREVEKLVYLSADRYVVQLMVVGWDANPPYYVMEFIEHGSLGDYLQSRGTLPLEEALDLFRETAVGLSHAHAKGVLHCDLKPANILLDQDAKPRLADFGQSRLSTEQSPSLGTLFYMAPEQADLSAVPDARWDVYALGAIFYCALVGHPPHRTPENLKAIDAASTLEERLTIYKQLIKNAPAPSDHRKVRGMDGALTSIIDQCLAADPAQRLPSVQALLSELEQRENQRQRRPLLLLGFLGPLLLLTIMSLFGWRSYHQATAGRELEITERAAAVNQYAARMVASKAAQEIARYYRAVEELARSKELREMMDPLVGDAVDPEFKKLLDKISDPYLNSEPLPEREAFRNHPARDALQQKIEWQLTMSPQAASWFVCDRRGTQIASAFSESNPSNTIGKNFCWRTYFHGGPDDLVLTEDEQVTYGTDTKPLEKLHLSAAFISRATNRWKVAISAPIRATPNDPPMGVVALTVDIRVFLRFEDNSENFFAVLVDGRPGEHKGIVLQHPVYEELPADERLPESFTEHRVDVFEGETARITSDPFADDPFGKAFDRTWLASQAEVKLTGDAGTGLVIQMQQDYDQLVQPVRRLGRVFLRMGLLTLAAVAAVVAALWLIVLRVSQVSSATMFRPGDSTVRPTPLHELTTLNDVTRENS